MIIDLLSLSIFRYEASKKNKHVVAVSFSESKSKQKTSIIESLFCRLPPIFHSLCSLPHPITLSPLSLSLSISLCFLPTRSLSAFSLDLSGKIGRGRERMIRGRAEKDQGETGERKEREIERRESLHVWHRITMTARGEQPRLENHHEGDRGDGEVSLLLLMSINERETERSQFCGFFSLDPDTIWAL